MAKPVTDEELQQRYLGYWTEWTSKGERHPLTKEKITSGLAPWKGKTVHLVGWKKPATIVEILNSCIRIKLQPPKKVRPKKDPPEPHPVYFSGIRKAEAEIWKCLDKRKLPETKDFQKKAGIGDTSYDPRFAEFLKRLELELFPPNLADVDVARPKQARNAAKAEASRRPSAASAYSTDAEDIGRVSQSGRAHIYPMKINQFFTDVLGASVRNQRWSWGAYDPVANRVFLRVWQDKIERTAHGERVHVASDNPKRKSNGINERIDHLAKFKSGAEAFGVVCTAIDPDTSGVRKIEDFDRTNLLRFGNLTKVGSEIYARIADRIPVKDLARPQTAHGTLAEDLKSILKSKIEPTTKDALVSARIGQGKFRAQVLQLWGNQCAVTGSKTQDAIRASHIKPWRKSDDADRLDPHNGLPLVASLDALFDAGLISFDESGALITSSLLDTAERAILGLNNAKLTQALTDKTKGYLTFHRKYQFRK